MKIIDGKHRASVLGLTKFIAALGIVYLHTLNGSHGHWSLLFLFVEFFFFITGYYTYKHFQQTIKDESDVTAEIRAKRALEYTLNKVKGLLPYIAVALIIRYITVFYSVHVGQTSLIDALVNLPFEIALLNSQTGWFSWPLWFVSAMVIALPLFCYISQSKNKHLTFMLSLLLCIIYYFNLVGVIGLSSTGYSAIVRAFVGMTTGVVIYGLAHQLGKLKLSTPKRMLVQLVEMFSFFMSIVFMYPSVDSSNAPIYRNLVCMSFILFLTIFMSGQTIMSKVSCKAMDFVEKMSMVLFMIHFPIMSLIDYLPIKFNYWDRIITTMLVSVSASAIIYCVVEYIKIVKSQRQLVN